MNRYHPGDGMVQSADGDWVRYEDHTAVHAEAQACITALEAQAQRDFDLAAEWKAALEAERVEHQALKDRVAKALNTHENTPSVLASDLMAEALRGR